MKRFFKYPLTLCFLCFHYVIFAFNTPQDTIRPLSFSGVPGISSSPETGFRYGLVGQASFDLFKNNLSARKSQIRIGTAGSSKGQFQIVSSINLFGRNESYFSKIWIEYQNWVDRHYGLGNDANMSVVEFYDDEQRSDTLNHLNYSISTFRIKGSSNRRISKTSFVGLYAEYFRSTNYNPLASGASIDPFEIQEDLMNANYFGLGVNYFYDTRDDINAPSKGKYLRLSLINFNDRITGDYNLTKLNMEYRHYHNMTDRSIFAFRLRNRYTFSDSPVPFDALNRIGGSQLSRGYFSGTFLDRHIFAFTSEYRFKPFEDSSESLWKFWKHIHAAVFFTGAQSFGDSSSFDIGDFNYSLGAGVRIPLTDRQRFSLRLDYAVGLTKTNAAPERPSGFYVDINEAF